MNTVIKRHTLSVLVENSAGVLSQVSRLFSRKGYNIESLAVGTTDDPEVSRITIEVLCGEQQVSQIINQLRNKKWKRVVQTTVYIPYFISVVVMVSMIQVLFMNDKGVIGNLLKDIGLVSQSTNIVGSASTFVPLYVLTGVWQSMGWNSIIYIAALSSVDTQLYDACKIDGANRWQTMWNIDFPAILPTVMILLIMNMGNILNVGFDKAFLMQNDLNRSASQVISTYVYQVGIKSSQFSFGTAVGLFNTVVNFVFLMFTNWISKRSTGTGLL